MKEEGSIHAPLTSTRKKSTWIHPSPLILHPFRIYIRRRRVGWRRAVDGRGALAGVGLGAVSAAETPLPSASASTAAGFTSALGVTRGRSPGSTRAGFGVVRRLPPPPLAPATVVSPRSRCFH